MLPSYVPMSRQRLPVTSGHGIRASDRAHVEPAWGDHTGCQLDRVVPAAHGPHGLLDVGAHGFLRSPVARALSPAPSLASPDRRRGATGPSARRRAAPRRSGATARVGSRLLRRHRPGGCTPMDTDQVIRLVVGLGIMALCLAVAARRAFFLLRLISSGQPAPGAAPRDREAAGGPGDRGLRPEAAAQVERPRRRPLHHLLGLHHPDADDHRGRRRAVRPGVRDPADRPLGGRRLRRGPDRDPAAGQPGDLRLDPAQERPGQDRARQPLLRLAHHGRLGRARA